MKKYLFSSILSLLLFAGCTTTPSGSSAGTSTYFGYVGDGTSMHDLQLIITDPLPDTMNIYMDDSTNTKNANLLEGNAITVVCEKGTNSMLVALSVTGEKIYVDAVGEWTMPDPIDSTRKMGVDLACWGKASSINMATLPYHSWEILNKNGELLLNGESIGNGVSFPVSDTVNIYQEPEGTWVMKFKHTAFKLTKQMN